MEVPTLPKQIEEHLNHELRNHDTQAQAKVKSTSLGWLKIRVITNLFAKQSLEERENKINEFLESLNIHLGQYPIAGYDLLTPQEAAEQPPQYIQLPLWSDILMAPDPDEPASIDDDSVKRPLIVTFYSFKGGVGRSTALSLVAGILAKKKRRVVMVDFDLEAPGISVFFQPDFDKNNTENEGVIDYLYQRSLTPDENIPPIASCIRQINLQTRGELFLVPVGEYDENYIHRLADLDMRSFYRGNPDSGNPVKQLIEDIKEQLDPDVILIDARPGFNDTGAIALLDLADTAIICFVPTDQSFEGLRWVVNAIRKQREYQGKPDIRFLLTPMPVVSAEQRQVWLNQVETWIEQHYGVPVGINISELYYKVSYNPNITTLSSLVNDVPDDLLDPYVQIANAIDASLPDIKTPLEPVIKGNTKAILTELKFKAATAQELDPSEIPYIFQRTEDFPRFVNSTTWLIRGAKGTGKSLLFRLFVEQPEKAKELAKTEVNLENVQFIAGHGQSRLSPIMLETGDMASYEQQAGENEWQFFWLNYALLRLCQEMPSLMVQPELKELSFIQENPSHVQIIAWLVERAKSPQAKPQATDELRAIHRWLQECKQRVWLFYDELDAGFGSTQNDYARRRRALEALLSWWLEIGNGFQYITPKIFLREDIWNQLNFTNKGHYMGRSLQLRWEEADLWRLVLRQALQSSDTLKNYLQQKFGVTVERLNTIGLEQLRKSLYPLWGERMTRGNKAYTYNWVRSRISDGQKNCFPRSFILLLQESVRIEKDFPKEYDPEITLRPKALMNALPYVSKQRVDEVRNEYPELEEFLNRLQGERSPIDEYRLGEIWDLQDSELAVVIKDMVDAGIITEYTRPKDPPPRRYAVADLYLHGLGMIRSGIR